MNENPWTNSSSVWYEIPKPSRNVLCTNWSARRCWACVSQPFPTTVPTYDRGWMNWQFKTDFKLSMRIKCSQFDLKREPRVFVWMIIDHKAKEKCSIKCCFMIAIYLKELLFSYLICIAAYLLTKTLLVLNILEIRKKQVKALISPFHLKLGNPKFRYFRWKPF